MTMTSDDTETPEDTETTDNSATTDNSVTTDNTETEPESAADDAADTPEPDPDAAGRSWRRRVLIGLAAVIFIVPLGICAFLGWTLWQQDQVSRAGQQAQEAAVAYAQILTSIDSAKVDENFNQVLDGATGEFKDMYSQSSMQLRQLLIDNQASAHGVVVESAIQSESKDTVVVLLFVDQSVTNTSVPDPRIDRSRIKMTMQHVDGRWRASNVELA